MEIANNVKDRYAYANEMKTFQHDPELPFAGAAGVGAEVDLNLEAVLDPYVRMLLVENVIRAH